MAGARVGHGGRKVNRAPLPTYDRPIADAKAPVSPPPARHKGEIRIANVVKIYGSETASIRAVDNCTFDVPAGKITVVVGPSGCGKTTLLNAIAGFHSITSGTIYLDDALLCGPNRPSAEPGPDRIVVFQNGALFPWKTIIENVAFGPMMQGRLSKKQAFEKGRAMLAEAGLRDLESNYPGEISSGMRRRVEITRALMNDPKVLLLDEPYRALDSLTKSVMHEALLETFDRNQVTIFFITHDLEEAIFLGHRVVIMTTRPCRPKKILTVDIPHPRDYSVLTTKRFREYLDETIAAVHEEALKAFAAGERER
jgi:NitT/TauT family transport system ATP-binding protein